MILDDYIRKATQDAMVRKSLIDVTNHEGKKNLERDFFEEVLMLRDKHRVANMDTKTAARLASKENTHKRRQVYVKKFRL
jgi:hypothetical protein